MRIGRSSADAQWSGPTALTASDLALRAVFEAATAPRGHGDRCGTSPRFTSAKACTYARYPATNRPKAVVTRKAFLSTVGSVGRVEGPAPRAGLRGILGALARSVSRVNERL